MKLGIVIPVLNQFEKAVDAIASIVTSAMYEIKIMPQYKVNHALSHAWNQGLMWSYERNHDFTLIINDDILFSPQCIDNLITSFVEHELKNDVVMMTGNNVQGLFEDPNEILQYATDIISLQECPDFSCFMVRPNIFETVGLFDENFNPAYFEDNDYHYRILLAGKRALNSVSSPYYHYGSQTQKSAPNQMIVPPICFESNRAYYMSKWGGPPANETYITPFGDPNISLKDWHIDSLESESPIDFLNMLNKSC